MLEAFARRLREERIASGLSQEQFALWGCAGKSSQFNYETAKRAPDVEYLLKLQEHGIDVGYILTGHRSDNTLSFEHSLLFELFGKLSAREREAIFAMLSILAGQVTTAAELSAQARAGREQIQSLNDKRLDFKGYPDAGR